MFARAEPDCEDVGPAHLYMTFNTSNYKFKYIFFLQSHRSKYIFSTISYYFTEVNPVPLTLAKVGRGADLAALIDAEMLCEL